MFKKASYETYPLDLDVGEIVLQPYRHVQTVSQKAVISPKSMTSWRKAETTQESS